MRALGLDASANTGSVALCDDDRLIVEATLDMNRAHSERLMVALDSVVNAVGYDIRSIELIAVSVGPGSFSGVRVGVTTAKALAYGLGVPVVAVPTPDAIAAGNRSLAGNLCVLLDARKREVYAARYSSRGDGDVARVGEIRCAPVSEILCELAGRTLFVGDGAEAYRQTIADCIGADAVFGDRDSGICRASDVARLGRRLFDAVPNPAESAHRLAPLYVRRPEAIRTREALDG